MKTDIFQKTTELKFDAKEHVYTHIPTGKKLISATQLIHKFSNIFDSTGEITAKCAAKKGITVEQQKQEWKDKLNRANEFGTALHSDLEQFVETGKIKNNENKKYIEQFAKIKFKGKLFSEIKLFDLDYEIAGTTDLIELIDENTIVLNDFKSNEKLVRYTPWQKRMLYPLDNIFDLNYHTYEIQLSLYSYILDNLGFFIKGIKLFHFNRKSEKLEIHDIKYRRTDVINMLNYYKDPVNFKKIIEKHENDIL